MSTAQHSHDGNQVGCVDLLLTLANLQVLRLILINLGGLSIVYLSCHIYGQFHVKSE